MFTDPCSLIRHPLPLGSVRLAQQPHRPTGPTATAVRPPLPLINRAALSTSVLVVNRPKLTRTEEFASSSDRPSPNSTCDGSTRVDVHADPDEIANSSRTAIINDSLSTQSNWYIDYTRCPWPPSVDLRSRYLQEVSQQRFLKPLDSLLISPPPLCQQLRCLPHPDYLMRRQRSPPEAHFLVAPVHLRSNLWI